ncbi:hypothetical protein P389DRAFT_148310, partial [Cystobasidium minutum MCA 4210]
LLNGNVNELGDAGADPRKSYLFSLTVYHPGIGLSGDRPCTFARSGVFATAHENPREWKSLVLARTHIRIRSPR